jgi:hypothetical protein
VAGFGSIDLYAGNVPISGANMFKVDKNPLNQIDTGIEDTIGKMATDAGNQFLQFLAQLIGAILGIPMAQVLADLEKILAGLGGLWTGNYGYLSGFFRDLEAFLGIGVGLLGTVEFQLNTVLHDFITGQLKPQQLLAFLVADATTSAGLPGLFVPIENLSMTAIEDAIGSVQKLIDAILATFGFGPGTGVYADVNKLFTDLSAMLGNPPLTASGFNAELAVKDFITLMMFPTNLVAGLVTDATTSLGLTGFIPMENLAISLIGDAVGTAQEVIDAILTTVGFGPGTGTTAEVTQYFNDLLAMLGLPALTSVGFNPSTAVSTFITDMMNPLKLLAPMNPATSLLYPVNIPGLDTSKIISGTFLSSYLPMFGVFYHAGLNWVYDPSFEQNLNWPGLIGSLSTDVAHTGNQSLKTVSTGAQQFMHLLRSDLGPQTVIVAPGMTFKLQGWVYPKTGNIGGGHVKLQMVLTDVTGANPATNIVTSEITVPATGAWTLMTGSVQVPTSPIFDTADFQWVIEGDVPNTDVLYIDDIGVWDTTQAQTLSDTIANALGIPGTNLTLATLTSALTNIPGVNIGSTLLASVIPGLDASKIVSGILGTAQIPLLDAAKITSGVFNALQIPGLDASKIITGVFTQGLIPSLTSAWGGTIAGSLITSAINAAVVPALDASKIVTGVFTTGLIPSLPASQITSGTFVSSLIPSLDASKITSGILSVAQIPGLDASQIVSGALPQWLLPLIPVGSVGNTTPNLLANPNYAGSISVGDITGNWTWDGAVDHTGDGSGSVQVIANGSLKELISDPVVPVAQGMTVGASHWLEWTGLTGTGSCLGLGLRCYQFGKLVNTIDLQDITDPAASSAWTQLSGSYTIPAGVDAVRLALRVLPGATAGTIHWDDGSLTKNQLLAQSWTAGLVGDLSNINTSILARALQTDVVSLVNTLGLGSFLDIPSSLSAITARLTNLDATGVMAAAGVGALDASKIVSGVFTTGLIPAITAAMTDGTGLVLTDTLVQAITGTTNVNNPQSAVTDALQIIPYQSVLGLLGATEVGGTIQNFVDTGVNAIQNNAVTGNSLSVFGSALNSLTNLLGFTTAGAPPSGSLNYIAVGSSQWITNTAVMKPVTVNLDVTMDSSVDLATLNPWGGTLQMIPAFDSNTGYGMVGFVTTPSGGQKEAIAWLGHPTGGTAPSNFSLAVYKLIFGDPTYGTYWQGIYASGDIHTSVGTGTSPVWNYWNLPSANFFDTKQGEVLAVACWTFDQTYNFVGATDSQPAHPTAYPQFRGALLGALGPAFSNVSTGPGYGGWPGYSEPIALTNDDNFVCIPVHIYFAAAAPPTSFSCDINGTVSLPLIDYYVYYGDGTSSWGIYWFGAQFNPGQFGGSATVHVNVTGGTNGLVEGHALSFSFVSGASGYGHANGTSATVAMTVPVNGGAASLVASATNAAFPMANTNGSPLYNIPFVSGQNFSTVAGVAGVAVGTTASPAWSFSAGGTANWGIAGLYLSGIYVWPGPYTGNPSSSAFMYPQANTPYFGLSATPGQTQYGPIPPVLLTYYGSTVIQNPAVTYPWANYFDLVVCGAGAGGDAGGYLQGSYGGPCGNWAGVTGTPALMGTSNLTITVGAPGSGGYTQSMGGYTGGTSSITIPGWGTVGAAGGVGHGTSIATGSASGSGGVSAPTENYTNAYGGNDQFPGGAGGATPGAVGQQPGGGGAGGNAYYTGSYVQGGQGGPGIAYIFVYQ